MARYSRELNEEHLKNPQPGDYWEEHLCIYFGVLGVLPNGNVVITDGVRKPDGQYLDEELAYEITPEEMAAQVKYGGGGYDGFVADVVVGSERVLELVKIWESKGSVYRRLADRPKPDEIPAWRTPKWEDSQSGQWEYYINRGVRKIWNTFTDEQKSALWVNATQIAAGNFPDANYKPN